MTTSSVVLGWIDSAADPAADPEETYSAKCVAFGGGCGDQGVSTGALGVARGVETAVVAGLAPATRYTCFVKASNPAAEAICSDAIAVTTSTPPSPPPPTVYPPPPPAVPSPSPSPSPAPAPAPAPSPPPSGGAGDGEEPAPPPSAAVAPRAALAALAAAALAALALSARRRLLPRQSRGAAARRPLLIDPAPTLSSPSPRRRRGARRARVSPTK